MNNSTYKSTNYELIDTAFSDQRLDNYLLSRLKKIPRSHIYHLIRSGQVRVNSSRVRPSYRLKEGDKVRIPPVFIRNSTQKKQ
ncbi:MAG: S4 domain-containing protein, partial [Pseudomonadota bacterium]|nr:S4 domain-containing protein [Pseudomonadota bacterium]